MERSVLEFHQNCRQNWNCHKCPICFYIKHPNLLRISTCMQCGTKKSLYFCVICGHVGCGADVHNHAFVHFRITGHVFIMGVRDFMVWDLRLNKIVHRVSANLKTLDTCNVAQENTKNICPCVVCLYRRSPKLQKKCACMVCDESQPQNLWICLSCSHIGCGRNKNHHAKNHYSCTHHNRVMQLENFSIWDYKERKYLHSEMHETVAVQSEADKFCSQQMKEDCFVATTIRYVGQNESICNRPAVSCNTATVVPTGNPHCMQKLPTAAEILQQQQQEFVRRIEYLERQWQEFGKLTETNKKMITIEKRLLNLTDEKKALEEKLHEHDAQLNKLLTQFAIDRENSFALNNERSDEVETEATAVLSSNCDKSPTSLKIKSTSLQTQLVYLMILGLLLHYGLSLILEVVFKDLKNLF